MIHLINKNKLNKNLYTFSLAVMALSKFTSAAPFDYDNPPESFLQLGVVISNVLNILIASAAVVLVVMVGYGVWKSNLATGDPRGLEGAKSTWTYALYGFFIVAGSTALLYLIITILGLNVDRRGLILNLTRTLDDLLNVAR